MSTSTTQRHSAFINYVTKFLCDQGCIVGNAGYIAPTEGETGFLRYSVDNVPPDVDLTPVVAVNPVRWESGELPPLNVRHRASSWQCQVDGPIAVLHFHLVHAGVGHGELRVYAPSGMSTTGRCLQYLTDSIVSDAIDPILPLITSHPHGLFRALENCVLNNTESMSADDTLAYIDLFANANRRMQRHGVDVWANLIKGLLPDGLVQIAWENAIGHDDNAYYNYANNVSLTFTVSGQTFKVNTYDGYDLDNVPVNVLCQWSGLTAEDNSREVLVSAAEDCFKIDNTEIEEFATECSVLVGDIYYDF